MMGTVPVATVSRSGERQAVDDLLGVCRHATVRPGDRGGAGNRQDDSVARRCGAGTGARIPGAVDAGRRSGVGPGLRGGRRPVAGCRTGVLDDLPELQRVAIDRVLLRTGTDGPPTDQRVTGSAVASVVSALAAQQPILLAIDDVQWLDVSSQAVLAFAARRLTGRVGSAADRPRQPRRAQPGGMAPPRDARSGPPGARRTAEPRRVAHDDPRTFRQGVSPADDGAHRRGVGRQSVLRVGTCPRRRRPTGDRRRGVAQHADRARPAAYRTLRRSSGRHAAGRLLGRRRDGRPHRRRHRRYPSSGSSNCSRGPSAKASSGSTATACYFAHPLLARGIYTHAGPARRRRMHRALAAVEDATRTQGPPHGAGRRERRARHAARPRRRRRGRRGTRGSGGRRRSLRTGHRSRRGHTNPSAQRGRTAPAGGRDASGPQDARAGDRRVRSWTGTRGRADLLGAARMAEHDYPGALPLLSEAVDEAGDDLDLLVKARLSALEGAFHDRQPRRGTVRSGVRRRQRRTSRRSEADQSGAVVSRHARLRPRPPARRGRRWPARWSWKCPTRTSWHRFVPASPTP